MPMRRKLCAGNAFPGARLVAAAAHRSSMHFGDLDAVSGVEGPRSAPLNRGMDDRGDDARRRRYAEHTQVCFQKRKKKKNQKVSYLVSRGTK